MAIKERIGKSVKKIEEKGGGFFSEFKQFAVKGNVIDLAIGIMIGSAFNPIVQSLVNDIVMPPIGLLLGKMDFSNLFVNLSDADPETVAQAKEMGVATINYGLFINNVIHFLIIAFVTFLIVKQVNKMRKKMEKPGATTPTTKNCPYCISAIPLKATKCPHCTSAIKG